jgi:Holliday junction DNA helicase RuvA
MIAYLHGEILDYTESSCLLLTSGGVGYEVNLPASMLADAPKPGEAASLFIQAVIREDAQELYGFGSLEERGVFQTLLSISKLGPKKALAIMSAFPPAELERLVQEEDLASLTKVPGIGKKTGQQILLELRYKLEKTGFAPSRPAAATPEALLLRDAAMGLAGLGYPEEQTMPVLKEIVARETDLDVSGLLREALKAMAQARS